MHVLAERRKFIRLMLPYGMLYVFDHYSARVGWVRDVGMGGLSFEFNPEGEAGKVSEVIDSKDAVEMKSPRIFRFSLPLFMNLSPGLGEIISTRMR